MARTRFIKPEFFIDPDIGELSPLARLLFIGLWTLADKAGRIKYEPKKVTIQLFPYDKIDLENTINELLNKPFIFRYAVGEQQFIQIINWERHQSPHHTEKESVIPECDTDLTVRQRLFNGYVTVKEPLSNGALTESTLKVIRKGNEEGNGISSLLPLSLSNNSIINKKKRKEKNNFVFIKPAVEEVAEYCWERNNGIDAEQFVDFYSAKGWLIGKNPMKDWRAAVRTWERRREPQETKEEGRYEVFR